jgi:hypothetical protein
VHHQALEKLSHEHPQAVLRQGGLVAVLSYLDFFQTGVQRVAVATAATMCRSLTTDNIDAVSSAVPILTNLLQYQVQSGACLAFLTLMPHCGAWRFIGLCFCISKGQQIFEWHIVSCTTSLVLYHGTFASGWAADPGM